MSKIPKVIRVFVASPGDVAVERDSTPGVINELNRTIGALLPSLDLRLELLRWESHAFPTMGRPQQAINEQIGSYDIFVGILWKRFGSPTGKADSGTEEEFRLAYDNWSAHGKPHILFYFNRAPFSLPRSKVDVEQLAKVVEFREQLEKEGLIWEYGEPAQFAAVLRPHLTEVVGKLIASAGNPKAGRERVPAQRKAKTKSRPGARIRIIDLGADDSFFSQRDLYIGATATLYEAESMKDGWYMGEMKLDRPAYKGDDRIYTFLQFKYEALEDDV